MNEFQKLICFDNLYSSMKVSLRGKGRSAEARLFRQSALENILEMKRQLVNHTYELSPYDEFIVTEPKKRVVKAGSFRDKVLQHCLCDYVLLPRMRGVFLEGNCAGQIGKGTLYGLDRLTEHLKRHYSAYGRDGYILKCDITKFFYSIDHDALKSIIASYFSDPDILWICDLLIDSVEGVGLPLGNQTSQVFALMYLSGLDDYIVNQCGFELFGRYMDDFYVISRDKEALEKLLQGIRGYLNGLKLSLNGKTEIVPLRKGIRFLGFHVYLTEDGSVIRKLCGDKKRAIKKRLRKYCRLVNAGKMQRRKFDEIYGAVRNHLSHGNCYRLTCELDRLVEREVNIDR